VFKASIDSESKYMEIEVTDNGKGIPQEILPKIFDPFFTTKPVNKGTGLGLSIAHGIIAEQGGTIEARSTSGKGTSFIIRIPQAS
jgi:signal transduction histidine kinase